MKKKFKDFFISLAENSHIWREMFEISKKKKIKDFETKLNATLVYSIKTKFCLGEWAGVGCLGWPEFSSSIFNALFNQIQEVH